MNTFTETQIIQFTNNIITLLCLSVIAGNKELIIKTCPTKKWYWKIRTCYLVCKEHYGYLDIHDTEKPDQIRIVINPPARAFNRDVYHLPREQLSDKQAFIQDILRFTIMKIQSLIANAAVIKTGGVVDIDTRYTHWNSRIKNRIKCLEQCNQRKLTFHTCEDNPHIVKIVIHHHIFNEPFTPHQIMQDDHNAFVCNYFNNMTSVV